MLGKFIILFTNIIAQLDFLVLNDLSLPVCLLLPCFPLLSRFFIFLFKRLVLLDGTKLPVPLIMLLPFGLLNTPDPIIIFALLSLVNRTARIVFLINSCLFILILLNQFCLHALPTLISPVLVAHLLGWIGLLISVRPVRMQIGWLLLHVLSNEQVPLLLVRYPLLVLLHVEFEFQALVNNCLRSYARLISSVEAQTTFFDVLLIFLPLMDPTLNKFLLLLIQFTLRFFIHIFV